MIWGFDFSSVEVNNKWTFPRAPFIPVLSNGDKEMGLVDTRCGRTLVRLVRGPYIPERMFLKCVHGDIKKYPTMVVHLLVSGKCFWSVVGVVYHLDCWGRIANFYCRSYELEPTR